MELQSENLFPAISNIGNSYHYFALSHNINF
jgi:hypothetical protein